MGGKETNVPVRLSGAFDLLTPDASFPKRGDVSAHIGSKPYFAEGALPRAADILKSIIKYL